jgi:hypothetical protein
VAVPPAVRALDSRLIRFGFTSDLRLIYKRFTPDSRPIYA